VSDLKWEWNGVELGGMSVTTLARIPLRTVDLARIGVDVDSPYPEPMMLRINEHDFLVPRGTRYVRYGLEGDRVYVEYQEHVRLEGPPAPCGLVDRGCDKNDYWLLRPDLLETTVFLRAEEIPA